MAISRNCRICPWLCALIACVPMLKGSGLPAQEGPASQVPLKKVVLFNSGVGFFEHAAEVDGNAHVELKFNVDDVNDLLKSMVLQDLGGGRISTVTYGSKDPITKTLKTFAIDLTDNPTLAGLLSQIRGERVQIDAPNVIIGTILGVERRKQPAAAGKEAVDVDYLNLLTDDGLRSISLETVGRIKLVNPQLDAELRQALLILAMGHATDKKSVTLNFLGQGKRPVRVGYIQEAPIWKTSYRLVLKDGENPFLQGWAIVENTTEEDWRDVSLTLVSGRPISFRMDLYQPLYVNRPIVEPELFASLRPQTYNQDLAASEREFLARGEGKSDSAPGKPAAALAEKGAALRFNAPANGLQRNRAVEAGADRMLKDLDPRQSVQTAAQAAEVGELFQYVIDTPVNLVRQQSAMLPIVNGSVQGEKASIFNSSVHARHPLNGMRLTNSTGLHLMQGPVTVFDEGAYAGDAQIQDLQPGTKRLISYAIDLDTEVAPESKSLPQQLVNCRLAKGVMLVTHKHERKQNYTVKNSGKKIKKVLIEYPLDSSWTLVAPKSPEDEKTRDLYRFTVHAEPGKPTVLAVAEERVVSQQLVLNNLDDDTIRYYLSARIVSDAVKKSLTEVIARKRLVLDAVAAKKQLEAQVAVIDQEQNRIRQNMAQLDRNTELYIRYVKKFSEQEDQVESLRDQIRKLTQDEARLRKALDDYLLGLTID